MVTMAQSAVNWRNTRTQMDRTQSLTHLCWVLIKMEPSSLSVCISVCLSVASHISETSEAIAIKFDKVIASVMAVASHINF